MTLSNLSRPSRTPTPTRPAGPPTPPRVWSLPRVWRRAWCATIVSGLLAVPSWAEETAYSIRHQPGETVDIVTPAGQPLLRYVYRRDTRDPDVAFDTAKVFAHVMAPGGEATLTKGPGGLFPHHRGIFVGWNKIRHGDQTHDLWHVRNTEQKNVGVEYDADARGGRVTAKIDWIGTDGKPLIREIRTYRVAHDKTAHAVIDLETRLRAVAGDLILDGDPEHAGVQFRPAQQVAENKSARYRFPAADSDPKNDLDLPWVACSFEIDENAWTVQHMSHPENPTGARWSAYRDYGRFGPFPVIELAEGETVTLRFRFRVTEGDAPHRDAMQAAYAEWAR